MNKLVSSIAAEKVVTETCSHPDVSKSIVISGQPGDDAQRYQEKAVKVAIEESKK
ncbi:MAG: hypothetical protein WCG61_06980 [Chlorobium sp.]